MYIELRSCVLRVGLCRRGDDCRQRKRQVHILPAVFPVAGIMAVFGLILGMSRRCRRARAKQRTTGYARAIYNCQTGAAPLEL